MTGFGQRIGDSVVAGAHQRDPVTEPCEPAAGDLQGARVAVEPDHPQPGQYRQEAFGVTAGAQGGVDEQRAGAVGTLPRQRGSEKFDTAVEQDGYVAECPWIVNHLNVAYSKGADLEGVRCTEVPVRYREPGVGEVRQGRDSGRGHDARARWRSNDVAECFIAGRGEVLFVCLLIVLPGLRVPDLEVIDRADHHALLGQVGVAAVVGRQCDPALRVGMLFVGGGGESSQDGPRLGVASRGGGSVGGPRSSNSARGYTARLWS